MTIKKILVAVVVISEIGKIVLRRSTLLRATYTVIYIISGLGKIGVLLSVDSEIMDLEK